MDLDEPYDPNNPERPRHSDVLTPDDPEWEPPHITAEGKDWVEWSNGSLNLLPPTFGLPPKDQPPPPGRDYRKDRLRETAGHRPRAPHVWEAARADYLAGQSATDVCRRYGLKLSTFRYRAAADGWRRADQAATEEVPSPDGGRFDEALDLVAYRDPDLGFMAEVCHQRMARAVCEGDGAAAHRWRRMSKRLYQDAAEFLDFFREDKAVVPPGGG